MGVVTKFAGSLLFAMSRPFVRDWPRSGGRQVVCLLCIWGFRWVNDQPCLGPVFLSPSVKPALHLTAVSTVKAFYGSGSKLLQSVSCPF